MHGLAAVKALGSHLDAVAAQNDLSAARLTKILTSDDTAWLSEEGQMFYEEEPPTAPGEPPSADVSPGVVQQDTGSGSGSTTTPAYPVAQTFKLHSRPGATKQIFLDFNGAEIKGTGWNTGSNPLGVGVYTGYDSDGHPATFSTAEDAWIQEVWRQVAETYAPFDVDVTTEDGGPDARERTTSLDTHFGTQVLFTNSTQAVAQLCNSTCLGLAWVGTFSDIDPVGFYQPAFDLHEDHDVADRRRPGRRARGRPHPRAAPRRHHVAALLRRHQGVGAGDGLGDATGGHRVQQGRVRRRQPDRGRPRRDPGQRPSPPGRRSRQHPSDRRRARHQGVVRRERDHQHAQRRRLLLDHR